MLNERKKKEKVKEKENTRTGTHTRTSRPLDGPTHARTPTCTKPPTFTIVQSVMVPLRRGGAPPLRAPRPQRPQHGIMEVEAPRVHCAHAAAHHLEGVREGRRGGQGEGRHAHGQRHRAGQLGQHVDGVEITQARQVQLARPQAPRLAHHARSSHSLRGSPAPPTGAPGHATRPRRPLFYAAATSVE